MVIYQLDDKPKVNRKKVLQVIYIYIYMCVCVCVCVYKINSKKKTKIRQNNLETLNYFNNRDCLI